MDSIRQLNPDPAAMAWSVFLIEKVHRCADCPIRKQAVRRPHSVFARIHNWHKTWWPAWKAHQTRTCPGVSASTARA